MDIISVADCLDAGTDNIGRCYAASKTVDMLIEELKKGRNRLRIYTKIYSELSMEEK